MIALVDREQPRPGDRDVGGVEHATLRTEPHDDAVGAIGDVHVARRIDGRGFRLSQHGTNATLRRAAGEQLRSPVHHAIDRADLSLAVEGGHEELVPATGRAHLRIGQGWPIEVARLHVGGEPRAAEGNPEDGPEVVDLAADVAPSRACEVEKPGLIERERRGGRDPADAAGRVGVEAFTRHVDLSGEAGRQPHLGRPRQREQEQRQGEE
jgi:hypothetical protein